MQRLSDTLPNDTEVLPDGTNADTILQTGHYKCMNLINSPIPDCYLIVVDDGTGDNDTTGLQIVYDYKRMAHRSTNTNIWTESVVSHDGFTERKIKLNAGGSTIGLAGVTFSQSQLNSNAHFGLCGNVSPYNIALGFDTNEIVCNQTLYIRPNGNLVFTAGNSGTDGSAVKIRSGGTDQTIYHAGNLNEPHSQVATHSASCAAGWVTILKVPTGRAQGECIISDGESSDHSYMHLKWHRSYAGAGITVLDSGGHAARLTGARWIYDSSDVTYGEYRLQVYATASSTYYVNHRGVNLASMYQSAVTYMAPSTENTPSGYIMRSEVLANSLNSIYGNMGTSGNLRAKQINADNIGSGTTVFANQGFEYLDTNQYILRTATNWGLYWDTTNNRFDFNGAGTTRAWIDLDTGEIWSNSNITAYSDKRVKDNILPITSALDKVEQISGYTYTRKDEDSGKRYAGVIAQEVLDVLPEVVEQDAETGHYSVAYGNLTALLIEAVKELKQRVQELESK